MIITLSRFWRFSNRKRVFLSYSIGNRFYSNVDIIQCSGLNLPYSPHNPRIKARIYFPTLMDDCLDRISQNYIIDYSNWTSEFILTNIPSITRFSTYAVKNVEEKSYHIFSRLYILENQTRNNLSMVVYLGGHSI